MGLMYICSQTHVSSLMSVYTTVVQLKFPIPHNAEGEISYISYLNFSVFHIPHSIIIFYKP